MISVGFEVNRTKVKVILTFDIFFKMKSCPGNNSKTVVSTVTIVYTLKARQSEVIPILKFTNW